jgi:uncharacterized protein (TIGR03089 family)
MGGFAGQTGNTVPSYFAALVARDPSLPLLTHYDDESGERTELSGATLANWVAKTANLLVDGVGLAPGAKATVWLPPHWQAAAVLLGSWVAGLTVSYAAPTGAGADVEFASLDAVAAGAPAAPVDRFVHGLAPMGMPLPQPPAGWADYITEVRQYGDLFAGPAIDESAPALLDASGALVTHGELIERAQGHAAALGITPGERVLIDADVYTYPLDWLIAPMSVGAPIVISTHTDLKKLPARAETERAALIGPSVTP